MHVKYHFSERISGLRLQALKEHKQLLLRLLRLRVALHRDFGIIPDMHPIAQAKEGISPRAQFSAA
jgi:hypothetical protein